MLTELEGVWEMLRWEEQRFDVWNECLCGRSYKLVFFPLDTRRKFGLQPGNKKTLTRIQPHKPSELYLPCPKLWEINWLFTNHPSLYCLEATWSSDEWYTQCSKEHFFFFTTHLCSISLLSLSQTKCSKDFFVPQMLPLLQLPGMKEKLATSTVKPPGTYLIMSFWTLNELGTLWLPCSGNCFSLYLSVLSNFLLPLQSIPSEPLPPLGGISFTGWAQVCW